MNNILNEINSNGIIVGIVSGVITGIITGIIGFCGVKKSADTTLKSVRESIQYQKDSYERQLKEQKLLKKNEALFHIFKTLLEIERNYDMTAMYIESEYTISNNNDKYTSLIQKIDKLRAYSALYFDKELSELVIPIKTNMNIYWGNLDFYHRHKREKNLIQADKCLENAYETIKNLEFHINKMIRKTKNLMNI